MARKRRRRPKRDAPVKEELRMAESIVRVAFEELRTLAQRFQAESERLVRRRRRSAQVWVAWIRRQAASARSLAEATRFPADLRQRGARVMSELDARRVQILARLERQATGLVEPVLRRLPVARRDEIA